MCRSQRASSLHIWPNYPLLRGLNYTWCEKRTLSLLAQLIPPWHISPIALSSPQLWPCSAQPMSAKLCHSHRDFKVMLRTSFSAGERKELASIEWDPATFLLSLSLLRSVPVQRPAKYAFTLSRRCCLPFPVRKLCGGRWVDCEARRARPERHGCRDDMQCVYDSELQKRRKRLQSESILDTITAFIDYYDAA